MISLQFSTLAALMLCCSAATAASYVVDRYQDDQQQGSLRWAIEQSNANPSEEHEILIEAVGQAPYRIKLNAPLPAIKSKLTIIGRAWEHSAEYIAIDGSNYIRGQGEKACPAADPAQYGTNVRTMSLPGLVLQDVNGVTLKGLDIHGFCIGVLLNRASNTLIQHNRISNNYGGAGIMITADDGHGGRTSTTTNNNKVLNNLFVDNGDGLELTRGAAFNLIADNVFTSTSSNPEPSQGIEILWGNDNTVIGNLFENYSDGLQINWGERNYIGFNELRNNAIGLNLTGNGNIIDRNQVHDNRIAIAIRSEKDPHSSITLSKNQIWNNGKDIQRCYAGGSCIADQRLAAVVFAVPGLEHEDFVGSRGGGVVIAADKLQKTCHTATQSGCNPIPNHNIQAPRLTGDKGQLLIHIKGQANQRYQVEFFANRHPHSEAEVYLGSTTVFTNAQGLAQARYTPPIKLASYTATITDNTGATSELSPAIQLH